MLEGPRGLRLVEEPAPVRPPLEPCAPAELSALVYAGENESDAVERLLARSARAAGALEVAIGEGLAALTVGDRLISLGFSCLRDYARAILDLKERKAQALAHLGRGLRTRPLLRAAVMAGEVRLRHAQTVLPVAIGDAEEAWVELARTETVRALEAAVRAAKRGADPEEEWARLRVRLAPEARASVDEALAIAGRVLPGSTRAERLEAMAQEYVGEHPVEAGDDGAGPAGLGFRPEPGHCEALKARLELETDRWSFLEPAPEVPVPDAGFDELASAKEIDATLQALAARLARWDHVLGYCAYVVRRTGLWRVAGFASFEHYCEERLSLSGRAVEQRAALERRLWQLPALSAARDAGLPYEKVRLLSRLPGREVEAWLPRALDLTCVELRAALRDSDEAQMRAARVLRARVPERVARVLQAAFRAVRAVEGRLLDDGSCLVEVARHFTVTWKGHGRRARTLSERIRERDLGRCQVPECSRRAVHAHHVVPRSHGGPDEPSNLVALCGCHHLRGVHGGYLRVHGTAPNRLVWELRGRAFRARPAVPARIL